MSVPLAACSCCVERDVPGLPGRAELGDDCLPSALQGGGTESEGALLIKVLPLSAAACNAAALSSCSL